MEAKRRKYSVSSLPPNYSDDTDKEKSPICQLSAFSLVHIFQFLPYADRMRIQRVCKTWQDLSKQAWKLERSLTLRDVDWGYVNNQHLSFLTNEIIVQILRQCCIKTLTCLDFRVSSKDKTWTYFLKRFQLQSSCVDVILTFVNLKAVDLTSIQLERSACKQLLHELFEVAPIEKFGMGLCPPNCIHNLDKEFFARAKSLRVLTVPKDLIDKKKDVEHKPTAMEVVQYQAIFNVDLPDLFFAVQRTIRSLQIVSINLTEKFSPGQFQRLLDSLSGSVSTIRELKLVYTYDVLTPLKFFRNIDRLTNLTKLIVVGTHIEANDVIFSSVGEHCKELIYIELGGMTKLTDKGIERFADLPKLRELHLFRIRKITDVPLGRMTQLHRLRLFNCPHVENAGLDKLLNYGNLQLFDLEFCIRFSLHEFMRTAMKVKADLFPGCTILKVICRKKELKREKTTRVLPLLVFQKLRAVPRIIQLHNEPEPERAHLEEV